MVKKWQSNKKAIRIERTYNSVKMHTEYITKTAKTLENIVQHMEENVNMYERSRQTKDQLSAPPKLTITKMTNERLPGELTVPVIAVAHFVYETPPHKRIRNTPWLAIVLLFVTALILFNLVFFHDFAEANEKRAMCKVYYAHGVATHISYGSRTIDIYALSEEEILTMNPWEKEMLATTKIEDCLQIYNTEEEE